MHDEHKFGLARAVGVACAAALSVLVLLQTGTVAIAQKPDDATGRYTLSHGDGGFSRLDKQTGALALCTGKDQSWSCEPLADRSAAATAGEQAKLEAENKDLRARLKVLEERNGGLGLPLPSPPSTAPGPSGSPPSEPATGQLPTEEEIDKAFDYVERVFKKLRDRVEKYQTPTPVPDGAPPSDPVPSPRSPSAPAPDTPSPNAPSPNSGAL